VLGMLRQVINIYLNSSAYLESEGYSGSVLTHKLTYQYQAGMAYPLKLGESRVSFWLECFGPEHVPVSFAGALEAGLLKGCPDCIVGNASILHSH